MSKTVSILYADFSSSVSVEPLTLTNDDISLSRGHEKPMTLHKLLQKPEYSETPTNPLTSISDAIQLKSQNSCDVDLCEKIIMTWKSGESWGAKPAHTNTFPFVPLLLKMNRFLSLVWSWLSWLATSHMNDDKNTSSKNKNIKAFDSKSKTTKHITMVNW